MPSPRPMEPIYAPRSKRDTPVDEFERTKGEKTKADIQRLQTKKDYRGLQGLSTNIEYKSEGDKNVSVYTLKKLGNT